MHARHPFMGHDMRTHLVEQSGVGTLGQEMIIHRPQHWPEPIRIDQRVIAAIGITRDVAQRLPLAKGDLAMKQPGRVQRGEVAHGLAVQRLRNDG